MGTKWGEYARSRRLAPINVWEGQAGATARSFLNAFRLSFGGRRRKKSLICVMPFPLRSAVINDIVNLELMLDKDWGS